MPGIPTEAAVVKQQDAEILVGEALGKRRPREMQRTRQQMAVVIDEHGGTAGVVTLEDLFEEVVGEIEEGLGVGSPVYRDRLGRLRVPGTMRVDEVGQEFDLDVEHEEVNSVSGLVLTKMDGDARGGAALSIRAVTGVPIKFIGTGEKLDALEPFHANRLAGRILGMGDVISMVERAAETVDLDEAKKLEEKMRKGQRR